MKKTNFKPILESENKNIDSYQTNGKEKQFIYFTGYIYDNKKLSHWVDISLLKENKNSDTYLEFEIAFDAKKNLVNFILILQEKDEDNEDWLYDMEPIGTQIVERKCVIGHSLLSNEEFNDILELAKYGLDNAFKKL